MIMFHMKHFLHILLDFRKNVDYQQTGTDFASEPCSLLLESPVLFCQLAVAALSVHLGF